MPSQKPPRPNVKSASGLSNHAHDWLQQLLKHLEINFVDSVVQATAVADKSTFPRFAIDALVRALTDSGLSPDEVRELMSQHRVETVEPIGEWTSEMNVRRFSLIDKEIQGDITNTEKAELIGLTNRMRLHVDSELNLPLEGAKALHRKLVQIHGTDHSS